MKMVAVLVLCPFFVGGLQAQAIYRCGPNGTEYSQAPCPGGRLVESSDPRSAAQRAEALRVAANDRTRAAELARERRTEQLNTKPARAAGFNGRPPPADAGASHAERGKSPKRAAKPKKGKATDFVAVEPGARKRRDPK